MIRQTGWRVRLALSVAVLLAACVASPRTASQNQTSNQTAPAPAPRADAHVIMISVDGLIPEYYTAPQSAGLRVPNLTRMRLDGAYAEGVEGVYPSVTYPAHTTLVTGVRPVLHGIVQNRIFEPPTEPQTGAWYWFAEALKSETLWQAARRAGLSTAAVGWPVTVGADIDYLLPEIWDPAEQPITSKRAAQYTTPGLLEKVLAAGLGNDTTTDGRRTRVAEYIIEAHRPNLLLLHLVELDSAHHRFGPRAPQAIEVMERLDGYIGRLVEATRRAGIFDRTTFFIVSDHGFAEVRKRFEPNVLLVREKLITLDGAGKVTGWKAAAWPAGGSCAIVLRDPADKATAAKVTEIFQKALESSDSPLNRIVTRADLDRLKTVPTAFCMLEAAPGFAFGEALTGPPIHEARDYRGTHGQLPSRAEMRSALIVFGEGARVGARLGLARMIDIAPTAAAVLGVALPKAEGIPIAELLKPSFVPRPAPAARRDAGARPKESRPQSN